MFITPDQYRKAFQEYLRKGTSIKRSIVEGRSTPHYIWRTRNDDKVRPDHAANAGQIFGRDNPPPTGHPGETIYENLLRPLNDHGLGRFGLPPSGPQRFGLHTGEPYPITDTWSGHFAGRINIDAAISFFGESQDD